MGFNPFKSIGKFISDAFDFVVDGVVDVFLGRRWRRKFSSRYWDVPETISWVADATHDFLIIFVDSHVQFIKGDPTVVVAQFSNGDE